MRGRVSETDQAGSDREDEPRFHQGKLGAPVNPFRVSWGQLSSGRPHVHRSQTKHCGVTEDLSAKEESMSHFPGASTSRAFVCAKRISRQLCDHCERSAPKNPSSNSKANDLAFSGGAVLAPPAATPR